MATLESEQLALPKILPSLPAWKFHVAVQSCLWSWRWRSNSCRRVPWARWSRDQSCWWHWFDSSSGQPLSWPPRLPRGCRGGRRARRRWRSCRIPWSWGELLRGSAQGWLASTARLEGHKPFKEMLNLEFCNTFYVIIYKQLSCEQSLIIPFSSGVGLSY